MHLDTVFTLCDADLATVFPDVVNGIKAFSLRPGDKKDSLDVHAEKGSFVSVVADALAAVESAGVAATTACQV